MNNAEEAQKEADLKSKIKKAGMGAALAAAGFLANTPAVKNTAGALKNTIVKNTSNFVRRGVGAMTVDEQAAAIAARRQKSNAKKAKSRSDFKRVRAILKQTAARRAAGKE